MHVTSSPEIQVLPASPEPPPKTPEPQESTRPVPETEKSEAHNQESLQNKAESGAAAPVSPEAKSQQSSSEPTHEPGGASYPEPPQDRGKSTMAVGSNLDVYA